MHIRKSFEEDIDTIMSLIESGRQIMRSDGNMNQWEKGYPSRSQIKLDVERGVSYVCIEGTEKIGTFAFIPGPEPAYAKIYDGSWPNDNPYFVIHRIASKAEAHGIFQLIMDYCFARTNNIRIDTHRDNKIMQFLLKRYDFKYCGIVYLKNGDERLAYQEKK